MKYRVLWLVVIRWWVGSVERVEVSQDVVMKSLPAGAALEQGYRRPCTMLVMCLNNEFPQSLLTFDKAIIKLQ